MNVVWDMWGFMDLITQQAVLSLDISRFVWVFQDNVLSYLLQEIEYVKWWVLIYWHHQSSYSELGCSWLGSGNGVFSQN